MNPQELAGKYPKLYHVSKSEFSTLRDTGLRSTRQLIQDLQSADGKVLVSIDNGLSFNLEDAERVLQSHRPNDWVIRHPDAQRREVRLRNQRPLTLNRLTNALTDGLTPSDWVRALNEHVFLFPENPLDTPFVKKEPGKQTVLALNTSKLIKSFGERFWSQWKLSGMNLGSTVHKVAHRGRNSMKPSLIATGRVPTREVLIENAIEAAAIKESLEDGFIVRDGSCSRLKRQYLEHI